MDELNAVKKDRVIIADPDKYNNIEIRNINLMLEKV